MKGKAKGVFQDYNESAEKDLSKAVKLDPKNVDAWNCLGECFWKNKSSACDEVLARTCPQEISNLKSQTESVLYFAEKMVHII